MSLLPLLFSESPAYPHDDLAPHIGPEDLHSLRHVILSHMDNIKKDTSIAAYNDHFHINVDVQHFMPEEISVKLTDSNNLTVEAKHEEKPDQHGYVSRHFVRRYLLPEDCDVGNLRSKLSTDGVLSISAPKKHQSKHVEHKQIPIIKTGPIFNAEHQHTSKEVHVKKV